MEETVARAREPATQRGVLGQVSQNWKRSSVTRCCARTSTHAASLARTEWESCWRVACSGLRSGTDRRHRPYVGRARAVRTGGMSSPFARCPRRCPKKRRRLRLSAIGIALGGKPRRLLPPGRGNRGGGRDPKVAGRLSVCRHAHAAEGAFSQPGVRRNMLDVLFKTY